MKHPSIIASNVSHPYLECFSVMEVYTSIPKLVHAFALSTNCQARNTLTEPYFSTKEKQCLDWDFFKTQKWLNSAWPSDWRRPLRHSIITTNDTIYPFFWQTFRATNLSKEIMKDTCSIMIILVYQQIISSQFLWMLFSLYFCKINITMHFIFLKRLSKKCIP